MGLLVPWSDPLPGRSLTCVENRRWEAYLGDLFGKFILNHPIVTVAGTIALLLLGFLSITTPPDLGIDGGVILVRQPAWQYLYAVAVMAYGVFLAFEFHRVVKKERHEVVAVSCSFLVGVTLIGWAFGVDYFMPWIAWIGFLATASTLPMIIRMAKRSEAASA